MAKAWMVTETLLGASAQRVMAMLPVVAVVRGANSTKSGNGRRIGSTNMDELEMTKSKALLSLRNVYLLWHTDSEGDEKLIGVCATRPDASLAIERVKDKPGFSEGGAFEIAEYELNKDHWTEGFVRHDGFSPPKWLRPEDAGQ